MEALASAGRRTGGAVTSLYSFMAILNLLRWASLLPFVGDFIAVPSSNYRASGIPKVYPNLNPAAAIPVDRDQIFRLNEFFDQFRMTRGKERGQYVPNSKYIFVRTGEGDLMMHPNYRHPAIASGRPVLYAGEAYFSNGKLEWWSNGSGNYRPDAGHAEQAGLPIQSFYTYEDVLKGKHRDPRLRQAKAAETQANKGSHAEVQAKLSLSQGNGAPLFFPPFQFPYRG